MNSTLRYTSQRPTVGDQMARVAAAGRVMEARRREAEARRRRNAAAQRYAEEIVADLTGDGAVKIGMKVCTLDGKFRSVIDLDWERDLVLVLVASTYGEDAEVWGIRADGTYCNEVF
jgi:hypothetical protein